MYDPNNQTPVPDGTFAITTLIGGDEDGMMTILPWFPADSGAFAIQIGTVTLDAGFTFEFDFTDADFSVDIGSLIAGHLGEGQALASYTLVDGVVTANLVDGSVVTLSTDNLLAAVSGPVDMPNGEPLGGRYDLGALVKGHLGVGQELASYTVNNGIVTAILADGGVVTLSADNLWASISNPVDSGEPVFTILPWLGDVDAVDGAGLEVIGLPGFTEGSAGTFDPAG